MAFDGEMKGKACIIGAVKIRTALPPAIKACTSTPQNGAWRLKTFRSLTIGQTFRITVSFCNTSMIMLIILACARRSPSIHP